MPKNGGCMESNTVLVVLLWSGPTVIKWLQHGHLHREDGPAIEADGAKQWWVNGKLHREDGPAWINADGTEHWWKNGEPFTPTKELEPDAIADRIKAIRSLYTKGKVKEHKLNF